MFAYPTVADLSCHNVQMCMKGASGSVSWSMVSMLMVSITIPLSAVSFGNRKVTKLNKNPVSARNRILVSKIPSGRFAELTEIVGSVLDLASTASSMVTGAILSVDGGYTAQ